MRKIASYILLSEQLKRTNVLENTIIKNKNYSENIPKYPFRKQKTVELKSKFPIVEKLKLLKIKFP